MAAGEVTRRLAAIIAADVAGYSRLTAADEEGTFAALRRHRAELIDPKIADYGGRVANTAGDSILIEFPSVVDALRCAIDVQTAMGRRNAALPEDRRILFRVGINLGDVIEQDGDLLGDGVNVAARLEGLAEPGGICISRAARDQVRDRMELSLEDLGEIEVKNLQRPVRVFQVHTGGAVPLKTSRRLKRPRKFAAAFLAALAIGLLGLALIDTEEVARSIGIASGSQSETTVVEMRPALVVLPFLNLSGEPEQEYFSDGITEDLTTALARIPGFLVTARNTAYTFKGKAVNAQEVGLQLGVRYMLEGSVRKQGDRLRLNAQLIETASGNHVWAESFDRPLAEIFIVQDELVDLIVGSVASRLRRREGERALVASPDTLSAYDLTSRARLLFRRNTEESNGEARRLLIEAAALDPQYAPAQAMLARVENFFFTSRVSPEYAQPETAKRVVAAAARAVALDPDNATSHAVYGMALRLRGDFDEAAKEAQAALSLAPNDPDVLAEISSILIGVGDYEGTVRTVRIARALDPYIGPLYVGVLQAQAQFALGDYAASKAAAEYCLSRSPGDVRCHESLVRALGELGPPEEANAAAQELLRLSPDYTVSEYKRRADRNRQDKDTIERWAEGLRKAGIPN